MNTSFAKHKIAPRKHTSLLQGDSLAVVLFLAAAFISLVLYITEKTPFVIGSILLTLLCISIWLIVHFVESPIMRPIALVALAVPVCGFAIDEWPEQKPFIASQSYAPTPLSSYERPCDARIVLSNIGFDYEGTAIKINGTPCITANNTHFHGRGVAIDIGSPEPPAKMARLKAPRSLHHRHHAASVSRYQAHPMA